MFVQKLIFGLSYTGSMPALGAGGLGSIPSSPTAISNRVTEDLVRVLRQPADPSTPT